MIRMFDMAEGNMGESIFDELTLNRGLIQYDNYNWQHEECQITEPFKTLFITRSEDFTRTVLELGPDALVKLEKHGCISASSVCIAGRLGSNPEPIKSLLEKMMPPLVAEKDQVRVSFWYASQGSGTNIIRALDVPKFSEIVHNYSKTVADAMSPLIASSYRPSSGGKLLLWRGLPGTGKTWMIRSLMRSWSKWADFNYITDPEQFFGGSVQYMMKVIMGEKYVGEDDAAKWHVLLLEDTGEMISADAKSRTGQGLSRLLNVVDGIIGQGLKVIILITTNEDINSLHPAAMRPGRCLQDLQFVPLTSNEANDWRSLHNLSPSPKSSPVRLADLYAELNGAAIPEAPQLGFVKA